MTRPLTRLTDEQASLMADPYVLKRLEYLVKRGKARRADPDDLRSFLYGELLKAVTIYEPSRGAWPTYAWQRLGFAVKDYWREYARGGFRGAEHLVRNGSNVRVGDPWSLDSQVRGIGRYCAVKDLIADDSSPDTERIQSDEEALSWLQCLPPRDAEIVKLRVLDGITGKRVGEMIGLTESAVSLVMQKSLPRLAEYVRRRLDATA